MARGTIPDNNITASTVMNSDSYAHNARLGNREAWTADTLDKHPWIQVNLQKGMNITAIAAQGLKGSGYITRFYLSYGDDGNAWMNYTVQGETKVSLLLVMFFLLLFISAKVTLLNYAQESSAGVEQIS